MPALTTYNQPPVYKSNYFSLNLRHTKAHTYLTMSLFIPQVNTVDFPNTFSILQKMLPSVLKTECFNDDNNPFFEEVRHTEVGHLFEHILLDYLCMLKIMKGFSSATYSGRTSWNWKKDAYGTFHIAIGAGQREQEIFMEALKKTIDLIHMILEVHSHPLLSENKPEATPQLPNISLQY